jgi:chromosome segregation ATPase
MKTLKERLDDLFRRLKEAKTLEEAQKIYQEIEDIGADAEKVASALEKANKEAKEHREAKDKLEKDINDLKAKIEKKTKAGDDDDADDDADEEKGKSKTGADSELLKTLEKLNARLDKIEKDKDLKAISQEVSGKVEKALEDAKLPKKLAKVFKFNDLEKVDDEISEFVQTLKNEELKDVIVPRKSDDNGDGNTETIKDYAKSKSSESSSSGITGKTLEI